MSTPGTDVVVVGAGPVGLTTAIALARRGVGVRVLDKLPQRQQLTKALTIHARTLEELDLLDVADELELRGHASPGIRFDIGARGYRPSPIPMHHLDTRFAHVLVLPQAETEAVLERRLREAGVQVEWDSEFISAQQHDDRIDVKVRTGPSTRPLSARYLVGCDSASSTVRRDLRVAFEGRGYPWVAFLADLELNGSPLGGSLRFFTSARGFIFQVYIGDGVHRLIAVDKDKQDTSTDVPLELEDLQDTVDAIAPQPLALSAPRSIYRWDSQLRQATQYRVGRAFLVGDAAHVHSPIGGQGMNLGIQDAAGLAWRLALVVHGQAPEDLLDGYARERHPADARTMARTDLLLRGLHRTDALARGVRNFSFAAVSVLPPIRRQIAGELSNLSVSYAASRRPVRRRAAPGDRIPDVDFGTHPHQTHYAVSLHHLLKNGSYALLVVHVPDESRRGDGTATQLWSLIAPWTNDALTVHLVVDEALPDTDALAAETSVLIDDRRRFRTATDTTHHSAVLVRPDAYIAGIWHSWTPASLQAALQPWVHTPPASPDKLSTTTPEEP